MAFLFLLPLALFSALLFISAAIPPPAYNNHIQTLRVLDPIPLLPALQGDLSFAANRLNAPGNVHNVIAATSPLPRPNPGNYTLDFCRVQGHCETPGQCIWVNPSKFGPCEKLAKPNELCFCYPLVAPEPLCEKRTDCIAEEYCSQPKGVEYKLCISRTYEAFPDKFPAVPEGEDSTPEPNSTAKDTNVAPTGEEEGCIDARALTHIGDKDLVYGKHRKARVLCDESGSCATPGHVVLFRGEPMMMRKYCDRVRCRTDVMDVNNPSYKRALRVASRTRDLEYTTFAARYESRAEESVIKIAVRAGL